MRSWELFRIRLWKEEVVIPGKEIWGGVPVLIPKEFRKVVEIQEGVPIEFPMQAFTFTGVLEEIQDRFPNIILNRIL